MKKVSEVMSKEIVSVPSNMRVQAVVEHMTKGRISLVLVKKHEKYIGLVTTTDTDRAMWDEDIDPKLTPVSMLMKSPIITIGQDCELILADRLMAENNIDHLPVTHDGEIIGMISSSDLLH